uniref:Uncharacterized protein n=1 Tax=Anguilla anguilla TaxID=7936 RepID=A0A0E9WGU6_ANGAN
MEGSGRQKQGELGHAQLIFGSEKKKGNHNLSFLWPRPCRACILYCTDCFPCQNQRILRHRIVGKAGFCL